MSEPKALGPAILSANYTEFSVSGNFTCIIFVLVSTTNVVTGPLKLAVLLFEPR